MKKCLLGILSLSLLMVFSMMSYAETSNNNDVKTPPAQVKTPPAQVKTPPSTTRDEEGSTQPQPLQPCQDVPSSVKVDARVQEFLTCKIIQVLAQPELVKSFKVKSKPDLSIPTANRLGDYPIEDDGHGQGRNLTKAEIKELQKLFFAENSYYFEASKRCRFRPDMGLNFVKGNQSVEVLFSFACNIWLFVHKDEKKLEDFDRVQEDLVKIRNALFPPASTNN